MPEEVVTTTEVAAETPVLTQEQIDFQNSMNFALNDGLEEFKPIEAPTTVSDGADLQTDTIAPATTTAPAVDYLKDLGFDDIDSAKAAIEDYKKLKAAPPVETPKFEFADEQSKKIHELLREGKTKEVTAFLQAQELVSNADSMNDEQKLKLLIKMQNPRFDKELIEDEYATLYSINEDDFLDDPMKLRKERLKMEQRVENDVVKAQEFFAQYKQKFQLPDITAPVATVDNDYEAYKADTAKATNEYNTVIMPSVTAIKETDIPLAIQISDDKTFMNFAVSIVPDKADLEAAKKATLSLTDYEYDGTGKFIPTKLAKAILLEQNFEKYAQSIARQAVNAERARIAEEERGGGTVNRDYNVNGERTEFQKQMDRAFA